MCDEKLTPDLRMVAFIYHPDAAFLVQSFSRISFKNSTIDAVGCPPSPTVDRASTASERSARGRGTVPQKSATFRSANFFENLF
jgi:hypothetical protein